MAFHDGIFAIVGYGMEVQVEGCSVQQTHGIYQAMPGAQQLIGLGVVNAGGIGVNQEFGVRRSEVVWKDA
jgi:hypothetical protein